MGIRINEAELVSEVTGAERIPVSDGSGKPKAVSTGQIREYVLENAGDENVQSDWAETDPTSDAYIKNKPDIPDEVTEQKVAEWGFTKNTGDYSMPSGGIPKSDLADDVQNSLDKADTALQSVPEEYVTMDKLDRLLPGSPFEFVDLGLPSGTLWATCNIGAAHPGEAGLYFAWGEIEGYKVSYTADGNVITSTTITDKDGSATDKKFSAEHYKWCNGSFDNLTKYNYDTNKGVVDNLNQLVLVDDAVYAVDRQSRMPSVADFEELIANTTFSKVVVGNRGCGKFTSKKNGNSIIFPAVGRVNVQGISGINAWAVYPTRELYKYYPSDCEIMYFTSSYSPSIGSDSRFVGLPIRAVKNKLYGNDDYYYTKEEIDAQKQDMLVSTQNIKTINGESILGSGNIIIEANGNGSVDLTGYATEDWVKDEIKGKQDTISDLETIRSGAALGATAIQSGDLSDVATSGSYNDLKDKPTIPVDTWRPLGTTADTACAGNDSRLSDARPASDVYAWAKQPTKPSYDYSEVGAAPESHSHPYLPLSGGVITTRRIGMSSVGLPLLDGQPIAADTLGMGCNGIGIGGTDTGNDGAAIFIENSGTEGNKLIIALGDDSAQGGTLDYIAFRYYDTTGVAQYESIVPFKSGILALTSDIPTNTNQLTNGAGFITLEDVNTTYATKEEVSTAIDQAITTTLNIEV